MPPRKGSKPQKHSDLPSPLRRSTNEQNPKFDFSCIRKGFSIEDLSSEMKISFLERVVGYSNLKWTEIITNYKHTWGSEKLPLKDMVPDKRHFPENEDSVLALRYAGNNLPFIGRRVASIFEIHWIEKDFGDVYAHNSKQRKR